jgi:metal-responsive CopG/Arc/MetJ family transcriptional regulator
MRLFYLLAFWYNWSYTLSMKTAISIPDELFESAERFAQRQGMSRSELYAMALRHYLQEHRSEGITERLDEIYSTEAEALDPAIIRLQAQSLPKDTW